MSNEGDYDGFYLSKPVSGIISSFSVADFSALEFTGGGSWKVQQFEVK